MKNDTDTDQQHSTAVAEALTAALTRTNNVSCLFCGDTTPDLVCPDCEAANDAKNRQIAADEVAAIAAGRRRDFRAKVGDYAGTVMDRLPDTAARRAAAEYIIGGPRGLTITGPGDGGKTRACVWVAEKELALGRWVEFRQCGDLRQEVIQHARNGEFGKGVSALMRCDILILDDFGNHEFTRTGEEFFLSLLERRTNSRRRTFLTTQYTADELRKLITTEQMADAILRRIGRQFATVVNTKENTIQR